MSGDGSNFDISRYKLIISSGNPRPGGDPLDAKEATTEAVDHPADLSPQAIDLRLEIASKQMHSAVTDHLQDSSEMHAVVDKIVDRGGDALKALAEGDAGKFSAEPELAASLESIVRTDGSRPSFMIRGGTVDQDSSPLGIWKPTLDTSKDLLDKAIRCVGRIDAPESEQGFEGTGFLIQKDVIMTNRHVLQVVADKNAKGEWQFKDGVAIDFGHEFKGAGTFPRRGLKSVAFAAKNEIDLDGPVNHSNLDLVLIELAPSTSNVADQPTPLAVNVETTWADPTQPVYTIGYPGRPPLGSNPTTLLEQLFKNTFGCKRLAPGLVMKSGFAKAPWTAAHDATTLGGNSGSVVLMIGQEQISAGLHYGGRSADPRENWAHILGKTLDGNDELTGKTLRDCFKKFDVVLFDRFK
jgi:Trypsin-like peptidase domain